MLCTSNPLVTCNIPMAHLAAMLRSDPFTMLLLRGLFSLPVALITSCSLHHPVKGIRSLSLRHIIHCYRLRFQSPSCATPVPPITPFPLTGYCGVNCHLQPLKLDYITLLFLFFLKKGSPVLSPVMPHRDTILTLCNIMADVSFFTLVFSHG